MMRLAVDASFVIPGRVGGAEQMVANLVQGLADVVAGDGRITVYTDHPWESRAAVDFETLRGRGPRFMRITRTLAPVVHRFDALLFTNYFTPPLLTKRRVVTVIHDLQYRHHPQNFSKRKRLWLRAAHAATLRLADVVVAISDDVRSDILATYPRRDDGRVITIHNPVSWRRLEGTPRPGVVPSDPYVLSVAAHYPHKNLETLLRGFRDMVDRGAHPSVRLVLAGQISTGLAGIAWAPDVAGLIRRLGLEDRVTVTGFVDDATLGALYRGCRVFAFPSLFEGFALPPVEALGFGLPVLTTAQTSIPEVTLGLATTLEDPLDHRAMADALIMMLDEPERFRPSVDQVRELRAAYDPSRIASRYVEVLFP